MMMMIIVGIIRHHH
ncbi:hypothetical protein MTR67_034305 [Solanum verrucosum]|uniref:Uncharacterized protein n=1 Tax=Solanum verrucosum TaxID=315347 RepID=A0AAF0U7Z0_SOLVR|nr:hypothetical protein MTR67_034305 [Solanum verrucosum]